MFLVAQLAGIVSSPRANALPVANAAHAHGQHQHDYDRADHHHGDRAQDLADTCCALHAYFAGVLPPAIVIETGIVIGESLAMSPDDRERGVPPGRLDRPPRPLL
jgi:hypothetical protein